MRGKGKWVNKKLPLAFAWGEKSLDQLHPSHAEREIIMMLKIMFRPDILSVILRGRMASSSSAYDTEKRTYVFTFASPKYFSTLID